MQLSVGMYEEHPNYQILDDALSPSLYDALRGLVQSPGWQFGHRSNSDGPEKFWWRPLNNDVEPHIALKELEPWLKSTIAAGYRIQRIYANGQTAGLDGRIHQDSEKPGAFTLLVFLLPDWKHEWGGEFVLHPEGEEPIYISPKPNRAVLFDGTIPHMGRAPARGCYELRITLAFKLEQVTDT